MDSKIFSFLNIEYPIKFNENLEKSFFKNFHEGAFFADAKYALKKDLILKKYLDGQEFDSIFFVPEKVSVECSINFADFKKTLIIVQQYAQLNLSCNYDQLDDLKLNSILKFICEKKSKVKLTIKKNLADKIFLFSNFHFSLFENSKVEVFSEIKNGVTISKFYLDLLEPNAQIDLKLKYFLNQNSKAGLITNQNHVGSKTTSNVFVTKVLDDSAKSYARNVIYINEQSAECKAVQSDKCLILNDESKNLSIPSMQVLNNDVSCKHSSTTFNFDLNQVWYLKSRALCYEKSRSILIQSFINC